MASYWDGVARPSNWPQTAEWPPPEPQMGSRGVQFPRPNGWPEEKTPWTQGAMLVPAVTARDNQAAAAAASQPAQAQSPAAPIAAQTPTAPAVPAVAQPPVVPSPINPAQIQGGAMTIPPVISSSAAFQSHVKSFGGNIASIKQTVPDGIPGTKPTWQATFVLADGQSKITVDYGIDGGKDVSVTGTSANIQTQSASEQVLRGAQARLAEVQTRVAEGNATAQDLENAQREANLLSGQGANSDVQVAQIDASRAGSAAAIGNTQVAQANVDLGHVRAVAEVLEKQGYAANQAYQMALNFAIEKQKVDQANTNTVVNAATSLLNNDTSLANARLSAANSGFSSDAQQAISMNEYMPIGSDKAADMLIGLTGMRRAAAAKMGAFDNREPAVLTQLGRNTPVGMSSLDYDAVMSHANALQDRSGTGAGAWPVIPNAPFGPNGRAQMPAGHTSAQNRLPDGTTVNPTSTGQGNFRPITWDTNQGQNPALPRDPYYSQGAHQRPIADDDLTRIVQSGGGKALSRIGSEAQVWISDPTSPAGRRLIHVSQLPQQADGHNLPDLPDPKDGNAFGPTEVTPVSFSSPTPEPDTIAIANRQQQDAALAQQALDEEQRRRSQQRELIMGQANPFDSWTDGTAEPWHVKPWF